MVLTKNTHGDQEKHASYQARTVFTNDRALETEIRGRLPATLRAEFPQLWAMRTEAQISEMLYAHCEYAHEQGLDTAEGVYLLLGFRLRLAWSFPTLPEHAWAREILGRELLSEAQRAAALEEYLWCVSADES